MFLVSKLKKSRAGFTLIELIVVLAILAILAATLIPSMVQYLAYSQVRQDESDVRSAYSSACTAYNEVYTDGNTYTDAAFTETVAEHTLTLLDGSSYNPPAGTAGHLEATVDQLRGVVSLSLTCSGGCTCTYKADTHEFEHSLDSHKRVKQNT